MNETTNDMTTTELQRGRAHVGAETVAVQVSRCQKLSRLGARGPAVGTGRRRVGLPGSVQWPQGQGLGGCERGSLGAASPHRSRLRLSKSKWKVQPPQRAGSNWAGERRWTVPPRGGNAARQAARRGAGRHSVKLRRLGLRGHTTKQGASRFT